MFFLLISKNFTKKNPRTNYTSRVTKTKSIYHRVVLSILSAGETESVPSESATGSAINIFFYNVEVVNNVTKIVLEWTLGSEKKTQVQENLIVSVDGSTFNIRGGFIGICFAFDEHF